MTIWQEQQREQKLKYWQPHIKAWRESGGSARRYCELHQLNLAQFKYWQYQIAPGTKQSKSTPLSFCEVKPRGILASTNNPYEVVFLNGIQLKIPRDIEAEQLLKLVVTLSSLPC